MFVVTSGSHAMSWELVITLKTQQETKILKTLNIMELWLHVGTDTDRHQRVGYRSEKASRRRSDWGRGLPAEGLATQRACGSNELNMSEKQPGGQRGWKRARVRVREDLPAPPFRFTPSSQQAVPAHRRCNSGPLKISRRSRNAGVQVFHFTNEGK